MRAFIAILALGVAADAAAQIVSRDSVHLQPIGSTASGSFVLVNKTVPLPEGEFTLIATNFRESKFVRGNFARAEHKMVEAVLGQMADGKLRVAVVADAVLKYAGTVGWVIEPCKDDKVALFSLSRVPYMKRSYEQNCLVVNRIASRFGPKASGAYSQIADWVHQQGGPTPVPMVVEAAITRIAVVEYLVVRYEFNPAAFGCDPANLQSESFANGVIDLGKAMQAAVNEGFAGPGMSMARFAAEAPRLENCAAAAPAPSQASAPRRSGKPPAVADRLRALDALRDQGLITPAEYDERRRKILDSL